MLRRNRLQKPPPGTPLSGDASLRAGLASAWLFNEGGGFPVDAATGDRASAMSAVWSPLQYGTGLSFNGTSQSVTIGNPTQLQFTGPFTAMACCAPAASFGQQNAIDCHDGSNTGGWALVFDVNAANEIDLLLPQAGTGVTVASGTGPGGAVALDGNLHVFAAVLNSTASNGVSFYRDAVSWGTGTTSSLPAVRGSGNDMIGTNPTATSRWFKGPIYWIAAWNRALAYAEVAALSSHPNAIARLFWPPLATREVGASLVPAIYSVTPNPIPANASGAIPLSVHGFGLGWNSVANTPVLGVSGVSGLAVTGQTILDTSNATLDVTTGPGTGTATVTDGTYSAAFQVVTPALSVSPGTMAATGTYAIALTGTGTVWPTGSQPGLFTASGIAGASISSIVVASTTGATATLSLGTGQSGGTLTVADTTTGATATATIEPAYGGSLHCTGRCLLQHAGGTVGGLSGQSSGAFQLRLRVNSWAGLALAAGTTVQKWASGSGSIVLFPATQTAVATIAGSLSTLTATIPVQAGVGYHLMPVVSGGTCTLYLNGLAYATRTGFGNFTAISGIEVGADGGSGVAADHVVSDVAEWPGYAPTGTEAGNLAAKAISPLQTATPATYWFSLGGGTVGGTPSISDPWFTDFAGNGNSLSVATGTLSGDTYAAPFSIGSPVNVQAHTTGSPYRSTSSLLLFRTMNAAPAANGGFAGAVVTGVNATPNVYRNGNPIQIGPPTWTRVTQDSPWVAYLMECGSVGSVAIPNGGVYTTSTPPTLTFGAAPAGGTTATGTAVMSQGVTSYTVTAAGSGFNRPPIVSFSGGGGGGAAGYVVLYQSASNGTTRVGQVVITSGGTGYTSAPTITISGGASGSGASAVYTGTLAGGSLQLGAAGVTMVAGGSGYATPPTATVANPPSASGPQGNIPVCYADNGGFTTRSPLVVVYDANGSDGLGTGAGTIRAILPYVGGLLGCGSGYATAPNVTISGGGGTGATATANVSWYVSGVTVTNPGSGYNAPPTITPSGGSVTTAATLAPIMTGATAADVLTYTAPASWLSCVQYGTGYPLGGLQAVTAAPITNNVGRREVGTPFAATPTLLAGANMGVQPVQVGSVSFTAKNLLHQSTYWNVDTGSGAIYYGADGWTPATWTLPSSTVLRYTFYGPSGGGGLNNPGSAVDSTGSPSYIGPFTLRYDDANVNTSAANATWLGSRTTPAVCTVTPVPQSGDSSPVTIPNAKLTISGGAITAVSLSGLTFASTYQGAGIIVGTAGGGSGFAANVVCSGGVPTSVNVICGGTGYTGSSTLQIFGTAVSGNQVTSVWNFAYISNPASYLLQVALYCANAAGSYSLGNPWVVAPLASGQPNLTIDRTKALACDDNVLANLTSGNRSIGIMRRMDTNQGFGGVSNFALPSDLVGGGSGTPWATLANRRVFYADFQYGRYLNTNPASTVVLSGTLTNGSALVTGLSSTVGLVYGTPVSAASGIPGGTTVLSVINATSLILSANATASGSQSLTFTNFTFSTAKCYSQQAIGSLSDAPFTTTVSSTVGASAIVPASMANLMSGATVTGTGVPAGSLVAFLGMQVYGLLTSGSAVVQWVGSTAGLSVGMPVTAYGVPANTTIASVGTNQFTMSANATESQPESLIVGATTCFTLGSSSGGLASVAGITNGTTLTFQNPNYVPLPASDMGFFVNNSFGSNNWMVMELRGTSPHGLRTGDVVGLAGNVTMPFTGPAMTAVANSAAWTTASSITSGSAVCTGLTTATLYQPGSQVIAPAAAQSLSGTINGTTTVTGLSSTTGMYVGQLVTGTNIPANTTIATIPSSSSVTLSAAATGSATETLAFGGTTLTGTLTGSSATVTGLSSTAGLVVGMGVYSGNTVVPNGTSIATIASSTSVTLTANATSGGTQSLVFSLFPGGTSIASVQSATQFTLTANAVATATPTLLISAFKPGLAGTYSTSVYVTGPYTIAFYADVGNGGNALVASGGQYINSNVEMGLVSTSSPNGWAVACGVPVAGALSSEPYEYGVAMAKQLGSTAAWINLPAGCSDGLAALLGQRAAAQAGPTTPIYLQFSNETWNNGIAFPNGQWLYGISTLISYNTTGTILGYVPTPLATMTGFYDADVLLSGHLFDAFQAAFVAGGGSASQVHRVLNSFMGGTDKTQNELVVAQQFGIQPDHVCVATYLNIPSDWPITTAFAPAGSAIAAAGSWPIDAINDLNRYWGPYSENQKSFWQGHAQLCSSFGQPLSPASVTSASTGGSVAAGTYYVYYTFLDGSGRETTVGRSQSPPFTLSGSTSTVSFVMPIWPSWAQSLRVYLSAPGAAAGVPPVAYASQDASANAFTRANYGFGNTFPINATVTVSSFPNAATPPATNLAAANAPKVPTIVNYEGGQDALIPPSVPLFEYLAHDAMLHPSGRDVTYGCYASNQQGCPIVPSGGATASCYYMLFNYPQESDVWAQARGACQAPGAGTSNSFATAQGGAPADGHDHMQGGQSTFFQGLMDFAALSSPGPIASGMAQSCLRILTGTAV